MTFKLRLPKDRCYHPASPGEPEWLMCWIPPRDLTALVAKNRIRPGRRT